MRQRFHGFGDNACVPTPQEAAQLTNDELILLKKRVLQTRLQAKIKAVQDVLGERLQEDPVFARKLEALIDLATRP